MLPIAALPRSCFHMRTASRGGTKRDTVKRGKKGRPVREFKVGELQLKDLRDTFHREAIYGGKWGTPEDGGRKDMSKKWETRKRRVMQMRADQAS